MATVDNNSGYKFNLPLVDGTTKFDLGMKSPIANIGKGAYDQPAFLNPVKGNDINIGVGDIDFGNGVGGTADRSWSSMLFGDGSKSNPGYLIPGLQTLAGLTQAYTGYKALGLAEDQFDFAKGQSNRDFQNQAQVYNTDLRDRQVTRLNQTGAYDTSTPEGKAAFERDLAAYVQANSIDPNQVL